MVVASEVLSCGLSAAPPLGFRDDLELVVSRQPGELILVFEGLGPRPHHLQRLQLSGVGKDAGLGPHASVGERLFLASAQIDEIDIASPDVFGGIVVGLPRRQTGGVQRKQHRRDLAIVFLEEISPPIQCLDVVLSADAKVETVGHEGRIDVASRVGSSNGEHFDSGFGVEPQAVDFGHAVRRSNRAHVRGVE